MSTADAETQSLSNENFRLPTNVKPTHYDLTIRTDLEELEFHGVVNIDLSVQEETTVLVLNAVDLEIHSVLLYSEAYNNEQADDSRSFDEELERLTLHFLTSLPAESKARLMIEFSGELDDDTFGYFHGSWKDNEDTQYYALTQMEPTAARHAFPCWDEPALKATFAVTMISRTDTISLSNMPVVSEQLDTAVTDAASDRVAALAQRIHVWDLERDEDEAEEWKRTKFSTTPPMSTYLLAYANGNFKYVESSYTSPISGEVRPLRLYTTPDLVHQAGFALDIKRKIMPIYEQMFGIEYPLPKLDTLAVHDFEEGAMENWGLITGRSNAFLVDLDRGDFDAKQFAASVMSHECAHMWFGNITTMEWWTYLYLNEGFATLVGEVIVLDKMFPDWKCYASFITDHLEDALQMDSKLSSHPIEVDCPDANEINQIFDSLSYSKAASVLRMLSDHVSEEKFIKGVSLYLKRHLYANSVSADLWSGISEASGMDVSVFMTTWIEKTGYPIITVTESAEGILVRQDRFLETGPAEESDNQTIWTVPISLVTSDGIDRSLMMDSREKSLKIDTSKPFKLNANTVGFYRVLYTKERLDHIAKEAAKADSIFTCKDRIGLVYDAMALSKAGFTNISDTLSLVQTFRNEREFAVWHAISAVLDSVRSDFYEQKNIQQHLNEFYRELWSPLVVKLGYEYSKTDSADTTLLRTLAITNAAEAGDEAVVNQMQSWFEKLMQTGDDSHIPPDLVKVTFQVAVEYGGKAESDQMKAICAKPRNPAIAIDAIYAMVSIREPALASEILDDAMKNAREQDMVYYFRGMSNNVHVRRTLANWFYDNYDALEERYEDNYQLKDLIEELFPCLSSKDDHAQAEQFFSSKDTSKYHMVLQQALESIKANAMFIERSEADLRTWLEKRHV